MMMMMDRRSRELVGVMTFVAGKVQQRLQNLAHFHQPIHENHHHHNHHQSSFDPVLSP